MRSGGLEQGGSMLAEGGGRSFFFLLGAEMPTKDSTGEVHLHA